MKLKIIILLFVFLICMTLYFLRRVPEPPLPALIESVLLEKEIGGLSKNLSGLSWDATTETLMAVINSPARVVQLNTNGDILQQLDLPDMEDTESLSFLSGRHFLITEERERRVTLTSLSLDEKRAVRLEPSFVFDLGGKRNNGLEGIAFSMSHDTLFIANEKLPAAVYKVSGFLHGRHRPMEIKRIFTSLKDISGLAWSEEQQRLYILSDEAKKIVEIDINGRLTRESYLDDYIKDIPQPEGIAIHNDILYVVSEPNRFYVLKMTPK